MSRPPHKPQPAAPASSKEARPRLDLSKVRHDLRTPINHILGYCEMLQEDDRTPASFRADLRRIHAGGHQLLALMVECFDEETFETRCHDRSKLGHRLRTPINHIIGYGEMLQEQAEQLGRKEFVPDLNRIVDAARRWLALMIESLAAPASPDTPTSARAPDLPASRVASVLSAAPPPAPAAPALNRLLVVDDDEANRDMLARRLRRQGFDVAVAESGLEALRMLRARSFDLVLLDVVMPGLDGYQMLVRMKSDAELARVPVIMISALDQEESVARCIEAGAEDYIAKPFSPVFLRARLTACLEKERLRQQEASFMRQIHEEKRRTEELLHVILPRDVVAELKATQKVIPRRIETVGVLFCDIVGFAAYSEQRQPEEIVAHLQTLVEGFERIAAQYKLEKIKTIGDSFMAVAGLLRPTTDPAVDCVRCGLGLIAAVREHPAHWQVRVGVHTGPVIAGIIGHDKYQYDVWGSTVNTASRLEQAGSPGTVCVTADTWRTLTVRCQGTSKGIVPIKGLGAMELFQITAAPEPRKARR